MSEFVEFTLSERKPKTNVYSVSNKKNGYFLGFVQWYGPWRQYCFFPETETVYERKCLKAIITFINKLMSDRKVNKGQKSFRSTSSKISFAGNQSNYMG